MTEEQRRQPNRLIRETSPYLQQHAYNPVDWYPWGEEALQRARTEDKPVFLSIGYSACHWCHVMEHESFEDEQIAAFMNQHFVNIKVDREERPDLDQIYMNAVIAMTQRGGWPMSVFLTPEQQPFYGGTYWPPRARMGMPGFADILSGLRDAWANRRDEVMQAAGNLTSAVVQMGMPRLEPAPWSEETLRHAQRTLLRAADPTHGGFGGAPKFPHTMDLKLLLRTCQRFGNEDALKIARLTLDKMAAGGIYDHLGGGFHRYSVDARWLVPHFEKMLYDNALLVGTYLEAWQLTGDEQYRRVVLETLDYVLMEMTQPEGGFYSTQDADSEGEEGKFFVWSQAEIRGHLGDAADLFSYVYDVTAHGNWEHSNILNRVQTNAAAAAKFSLTEDEVAKSLADSRSTLMAVRRTRVAPGRDDKVLTSWNGLMIAAMARAGAAMGEPAYIDDAVDAADFILAHLRTEAGTLLHSWKDGQAKFTGYLDDYACLLDGLAELYQATFDPRHLQAAAELAEVMVRLFHDPDQGGFFYTGTDHETLITRQKDLQDNATPSGNSMAATALLKLGRLCSRPDWEELAAGTLEVMSGQFERMSTAHGQSFVALDFLLGPSHEFVFKGGSNEKENRCVLQKLQRAFLPNKVLAAPPASATPDILAPLLDGKNAVNSQPTLYICETGLCQSPLVGREAIEARLALK